MAKQPGKTNTMFAVLGILSMGPHTGYDIKQHMEQSTRFFWNENYGQIYPGLAELLERGDIAIKIIKRQGKPDKKLYSITAQGKSTLSSWLSQPMEHIVIHRKSELLLRVFFGANTAPEITIQHMQEHREKLVEALQQFEDLERWITSAAQSEHTDKHHIYWLMTIDYMKCEIKGLLEWCDNSIKRLGG